MAAGCGFRMTLTDNHDHFYAALFKALGHLDGHQIATAGGCHERAVFGGDFKVSQDAFGETRDIFEEHRLPLPIRPNDSIMKRERELNDRIETGKRAVARPHLLNQDPAVPGTEE